MSESLLYRTIADSHFDGLFSANRERLITYWNKGAELLSGFSAGEVIGRMRSHELLTSTQAPMRRQEYPDSIPVANPSATSATSATFLQHKCGSRIEIASRSYPIISAAGEFLGDHEVFTAIDTPHPFQQHRHELLKLSYLDILTQLANRSYIEQALRAHIQEFNTYALPFGVLLIEIDNFQHYIDAYPTPTANDILAFAARNFSAHAQPFDLYSRLEEGTFLGIIKNVSEIGLTLYCQELKRRIEQSYIICNNHCLAVRLNISGTLVRATDTAESMISRCHELLELSQNNPRTRIILSK